MKWLIIFKDSQEEFNGTLSKAYDHAFSKAKQYIIEPFEDHLIWDRMEAGEITKEQAHSEHRKLYGLEV